ncbi:MAG: hypothetical protein OHK0032_09160 [Thermodesulfovibrionales bacterium]
MDIPLKGSLREYSLPKILVALNRRRATGTLSVTTPGFTKNIFMKDGNAIFASSTVEDDRLGEMLVKAGKINIEQYDRSVELLKATGKRQGAILVELGYITPKDLFWGVKYQVKEIIYSLFQLEDGTYEFDENTVPSNEVITLRISMENLIYEGVKRIDNWTKIRKEMPDPDTVFKLNEDPAGFFRGIELSAQDRRIHSLVDGEKSIKQLIEESRENSFEAMKTLYVLWSTGFIVKKQKAEQNVEHISIEEILKTMSEEEQILRKRIEEMYGRLGSISAAELLQVDRDTGPEEIKKNYYRLAREFHPDRVFNSEDKELNDKLTTIFDAVTKAYNLLKDDAKRQEYFDNLGRMHKQEEDTHPALIGEQFKRGVEEFKKGNFWGAVDIFRWVTKEDPRNPKAWSYLSLTLSKIPHRLKDAEEALLEAIRLEPFNSEHLANLGLIYLRAGLKKRARHQFERALRIDPENEKAIKGLEQTD